MIMTVERGKNKDIALRFGISCVSSFYAFNQTWSKEPYCCIAILLIAENKKKIIWKLSAGIIPDGLAHTILVELYTNRRTNFKGEVKFVYYV